MKLMCTGHREIQNRDWVYQQCLSLIQRLQPELCISGGAGGADSIFADAALESGVALDLVYPNRYYTTIYSDAYLNDTITERYAVERDIGDSPLGELWYGQKWWVDNFTRNRDMIKNSTDTVIISAKHPTVLLNDKKGGTASCVKDMVKAGRTECYWIPDILHYVCLTKINLLDD